MPRHPFQTDRMVYSLYRSDLLVLAIRFQALTGPIFSYLWNPFRTSYTDFRLGIPRFRVLGPISDCKLHITSWSSRRQVGAPSLDYSATGPQVMIATDNTAVVSVFPQQGGISPHAPSCPVVVFYSIASISPVTVNQPLTTEWSLNPEIVPGLFGSWDTPKVDMLASGHSLQYPPFPV